MQLLNYLILALTLLVPSHVNVTMSAPLQSIQHIHGTDTPSHLKTLSMRAYIPLMTQAESWPLDHSPTLQNPGGQEPTYELPAVTDVFKALTPHAEIFSSPATLGATSPTSILPQATTTGTLQPVEPGNIVVTVPIRNPEATPNVYPGNSSNSGTHAPYPVPVHKLIIIASIMGAIFITTFLIFILSDRRALGACRRIKSSRETWMNLGFSGKEKELPMPPWLRFSLSFSSRRSGMHTKPLAIGPSCNIEPKESKVINVTPDFPSSKFSVTSSDYTYSSSSSNHSFTSALSAILEHSTSPSPLLSPSEFFTLPSVADLQNPRHSRALSAPIFGRILPAPTQPTVNPLRSGEHRRSKSLSGLVYIVKPSVFHRKESSQ